MRNNNHIFVICLLIFVIAIFTPVSVLYVLEDKNISYLNRVLIDLVKDRNANFNNEMINTIYVKYNGTNYNVSTFDEFQYSVVEKVIGDNHIINETLLKLKELESVGLLKDDFFVFLESNERIITRTNDFDGKNLNYSNKKIFISNDNFENSFMSFEIENVTNKIIGLKVPKEYVLNNHETLKNYIAYLNLENEDWIFKNDSIISKISNIEIKVENINNCISISIVPYLD